MLNISKFVNVTTKQVGLLVFPKMAMGHINFGKILWQIWKIVVPGRKITFFNYGDRLKAYWKYPYIYVPLLWLNLLELNLSGIWKRSIEDSPAMMFNWKCSSVCLFVHDSERESVLCIVLLCIVIAYDCIYNTIHCIFFRSARTS